MIGTCQPKAKPSIHQLLPCFQEIIPAQFVREEMQTACAPKRFYERLFSPLILVWCLVFQRLNADHTCDAVVSHLASGAIDHLDDRHQQPPSQRMRSQDNSAFCQARQRLPLAVLTAMLRLSASCVRRKTEEAALWLGHPVALLDGSTILLYPNDHLIKHYGQHTNNYGPCYWAMMRVTACFCLLSGALLALAEGPLRQSEQFLAKTVLAQLQPKTVAVGDRNFGVYSVAQAARHHAVFVLLRLTAVRARALAKRSLHSGMDLPVSWAPSGKDQYDPDMSSAPIAGRLIYVHIERDGFRPVDLYFFTTLLEAALYTVDELRKLYAQRWHVELDLLYVKDTLDMGLLYAETVDTVRKELYAGLIAYNVIRAYMAQAAGRAGLTPLALSFTMCWRRVRDTLSLLRPTDTPEYAHQEIERMLEHLSRCILPEHERFRIEPRAVRHRPVVYPSLRGSRKAARQRTLEELRKPAKS